MLRGSIFRPQGKIAAGIGTGTALRVLFVEVNGEDDNEKQPTVVRVLQLLLFVCFDGIVVHVWRRLLLCLRSCFVNIGRWSLPFRELVLA
uniref:Uncharacterized protein n=1 Tax=Solanum tuberosum TaxID=4113 RepID=M1BZW3_SOLTU